MMPPPAAAVSKERNEREDREGVGLLHRLDPSLARLRRHEQRHQELAGVGCDGTLEFVREERAARPREGDGVVISLGSGDWEWVSTGYHTDGSRRKRQPEGVVVLDWVLAVHGSSSCTGCSRQSGEEEKRNDNVDGGGDDHGLLQSR